MAPFTFTQRLVRTLTGMWPVYRAHRQAGRSRRTARDMAHAWVWGYMTPWGTLTVEGLAEKARRIQTMQRYL